MKILMVFAFLMLSMSGKGGADEVAKGQNDVQQGAKIQFVEDLRFGNTEEGPYFWALPTTNLAVDQKGHIYVADTGETRVLEFDDSGKFIKVLVRKGQGPGEMPYLSSFQIFADGGAVAFGIKPSALPVFQFYDSKLEYKKKLAPGRLGVIPGCATFSPLGDLFFSSFTKFNLVQWAISNQTGILNTELGKVKELSQFDQKFNMSTFRSPKGLQEYLSTSFEGRAKGQGVVAFDREGNVYTADSNKYEITKWNPDMTQELMNITKDFTPTFLKEPQIRGMLEPYRYAPVFSRIVDDAFVDDFVSNMKDPLVKQAIFGMLVTDEGDLVVIHDLDTVTGRQVAHFFGPDGNFMGQASLDNWAFLSPFSVSASVYPAKMVFKNNLAYTVETNADDEQQVVRYRFDASNPATTGQ